MKRFLLSLIVAGGLALMAAPQAGAQTLCGQSYAVLITGGAPSMATDGAVTGAAGVGVLQFGAASPTGGAGGNPGCGITSGEMILNTGDIQTSPIGLFAGPDNCYANSPGAGWGVLLDGVPCFDGANHITGGYLTMGGPGGTYVLSGASGFQWFDGTAFPGTIPFGFYVEPSGKSTAIGVSIPDEVDVNSGSPGNGPPVVQITLQLQSPGNGAVPTAYGAAPYLGTVSTVCSGVGSNSTDLIAAGQAAATYGFGQTVTGSVGNDLVQVTTFDGLQPSSGFISFSANDSYIISSGAIGNSPYCPFLEIPGSFTIPLGSGYGQGAAPVGAVDHFPDGASNSFANLTSPPGDPNCTTTGATPGAGFANSGVQWGAGDVNQYTEITGLFSLSTGMVAPGDSATCTGTQASAKVPVFKISAKSPPKSTGTPTSSAITVTNASIANCDTETSMSTTSATGSYGPIVIKGVTNQWDTTCTLSLPGSPVNATVYAAAINPLAQTVASPSCVCTCVDTGSFTGTCKPTAPYVVTTSVLTLGSQVCPIAATPTITCVN